MKERESESKLRRSECGSEWGRDEIKERLSD